MLKLNNSQSALYFFVAFFNFTKNGQESKFSMENGVQTPLISMMKKLKKNKVHFESCLILTCHQDFCGNVKTLTGIDRGDLKWWYGERFKT